MDLEQQAKKVEKSVNIQDLKFIEGQLMLSHVIGEQNFDLEVSNIEEFVVEDVKDENCFPLINEINDNINKKNF